MSSRDLDLQIRELEQQKKDIEKKEKETVVQELFEQSQKYIGKVFVRGDTCYSSTIFSLIRIEKVYLNEKSFDKEVRCSGSKVFVSLINPVHKINKRSIILRTMVDVSFLMETPKQKKYLSSPNHSVSISVFDEQIHHVDNNKDVISIGYSKDRYYIQKYVDHSLFEKVIQDAVQFGNYGHELFSYLWKEYDKKRGYTLKQEETTTIYSETFYSQMKDALAYCEEHGIELSQLVEAVKKVAKWNYFNSKYELPEMKTYSMFKRDKGILATVHGGDGGTDYEPYVTHYVLDAINIDWLHILYPIRQRLKTTVGKAAQHLDSCGFYNINYWNCEYNTASYYASFRYVEMRKEYLDKLNSEIKSLLK